MFCSACGKELSSRIRPCRACGDESHIVHIEGDPLARPGVITLIAVLNLLAGSVQLLVGGLNLAFGLKNPEMLILGLPLLLVGVIQLVAGIGLWKMTSWGRAIQIGLSILGLLAFPIGTIISILVLYYLFRPGCKALFSGKSADQLTVDELKAIKEIRGSSVLVIIIAIVVGVFMCGIISAIAIPNLLNAIDRGKQKRSMADIRSVAAALEGYSIDKGGYPAVSSIDELRPLLESTYIRTLPGQDGWTRPYQVDCALERCEIRSLGKDGQRDASEPQGPTMTFDSDIVMENGEFVQWPEGFQE